MQSFSFGLIEQKYYAQIVGPTSALKHILSLLGLEGDLRAGKSPVKSPHSVLTFRFSPTRAHLYW